jgi:hypothetical protein
MHLGYTYLGFSNGCILQIWNLIKGLNRKLMRIFPKLKRKEKSIYRPTDL